MNRIVLLVMVAALLTTGCNRYKTRGNASGGTTETIAPANAQPAPTGTDALTQTTEVEDSRSEADGGVTSPAATTTAKAPAAKKPAAKKHTKK